MSIEFVFLLAFVWGLAVAMFIQFTVIGDFLSKKMSWFLTALGCGGDVLLLLLLTNEAGMAAWWHFVAILFVSSIPVSFRGTLELLNYTKREMDDAKNTHS